MDFRTVFSSFLSDVLARDVQKSIYSKRNPKQKNSAIAIIVKHPSIYSQNNRKQKSKIDQISTLIDYFQNAQVLFLQRVNEQGLYSKDICMPGGKKDPQQTILQTAIRETKQETGIQLKQSQLLGMINHRFVALRSEKLFLVTYAFVFLITDSGKININKQQIFNYWWVSVKNLILDKIQTTVSVQDLFEKNKLNIQYFSKSIKKIQWRSVDVGLSKSVFGTTFYIFSYFISLYCLKIARFYTYLCLIQEKILKKSINQYKQKFLQIKYKVEHCLTGCIRFKNQYYKMWNVVYKNNSSVHQSQNQKAEEIFYDWMRIYYPQRSRF